MADFLLVLGKLNLAMGAAIIVVCLLRRPLRASFGAPIAYAIWLLVPIAVFASLLPPRVAPPPAAHVMQLQNPAVQNRTGPYPAAQMPVTMPVAQPAPRVPEQLTAHIAPVQSVISAQTVSLEAAFFDYAALLLAAWVLGAMLMALYLARLQARFHAAARLGEAGPAVLGFFRPRVVMPDNFQEQYTAAEQSAIMAHERVHLARQDARINALTALLRSLCWFNPLVHLGAAWLRVDQELACDATALAGPVSRRDYANALVKSQMMVTALPLGCNWPGSQHPLIERIALLKRKRPGTARRVTGMGLVMFAATFAGLGAWAAQPPSPAKSVAVPSIHKQIALAAPPVRNTTVNQNAGDTGSPPVADANPIAGNAAKNIPVTKPGARPQANTPVPNNGSAEAQSLPIQDSLPEQIGLALNEASDAALAKAAADASNALSDRTVARQIAANGTTAAPAEPDSVSAMELLSKLGTGVCGPAAIGTVASVHSDPQFSGTDIVLEDSYLAPGPGVRDFGVNSSQRSLYALWRKQGVFTAIVPVGSAKNLPALDSYVGQKVAIWPGVGRDWEGGRPYFQITDPRQLQLLSTALADPKKTWCYLTRIQRAFASEAPPAAAVTLNDQPGVAMQPATPNPSAGVVAAVTPEPASSDPYSGMGTLVNGKCQPISDLGGHTTLLIIGTVAGVHTDPARFGTDIVLNHILPTPEVSALIKDGTLVALADSGIRTVSGKPLDTVVGRKVAIWTVTTGGGFLRKVASVRLLCDPSQVHKETELLPNDASAPATALALNAPPAAPAQSASEASPAAAVKVNNQPAGPMQPAMSDPSAGPVQVAAAKPASAGSDPYSGLGVLVKGKCQPITRPIPDRWDISASRLLPYPVVGTLVAIKPDPQWPGTDIVLDHILPAPGVSALIQDGRIIQGWAPNNQDRALAKYVGQKVAMIRGVGVMPVCHPSQVQRQQSAAETLQRTASDAPAEAASRVAMGAPISPFASTGIRPEINQLLRQAQLLSNAIHPDKVAIVEKFKVAEAKPNLTRYEKRSVALAETNILGNNSSGFGNNLSMFDIDLSHAQAAEAPGVETCCN
jgi:beta-lactamase regulating signal transducer with metallopeptidase domain